MMDLQRQIRIARNDVANEIEYLNSLGRKPTKEEMDLLEVLKDNLKSSLRKKTIQKNKKVKKGINILKKTKEQEIEMIFNLHIHDENFYKNEGKFNEIKKNFKEILAI